MIRTFGARNCRLVLLHSVRKVDWLSCRASRRLMDLPQDEGGFSYVLYCLCLHIRLNLEFQYL